MKARKAFRKAKPANVRVLIAAVRFAAEQRWLIACGETAGHSDRDTKKLRSSDVDFADRRRCSAASPPWSSHSQGFAPWATFLSCSAANRIARPIYDQSTDARAKQASGVCIISDHCRSPRFPQRGLRPQAKADGHEKRKKAQKRCIGSLWPLTLFVRPYFLCVFVFFCGNPSIVQPADNHHLFPRRSAVNRWRISSSTSSGVAVV